MNFPRSRILLPANTVSHTHETLPTSIPSKLSSNPTQQEKASAKVKLQISRGPQMPGMEELSSDLNTRSRKRKIYPKSSNPFTGIQTRNKSQIFVHRTLSRADPVARTPVSFRTEPESAEIVLGGNCEDLSRISRVKDLRTRRIFTPDANSITDDGEEREDENNEGSKSVKSVDLGLEASPTSALDLPLEAPEVDKSQMRDLEEKEKNVNEGKGLFKLSDNNSDESRDLFPDVGSVVPEVDNNIPKNAQISGNGPSSRSKTVVNLCKRRKVFSSPSSFSFRRLLPYLMDTKNDDSSGSKLEIPGVTLASTMQKSGVSNSELRLVSENVNNSEVGQQIHMKVPCNEHEIGQMTPPDPYIFSKIDNELIKNQIHDNLSVGNGKSKYGSLKESKCTPNLTVLPCSRLRVFKNPKSVSYRRLLPFLLNMSKENSCASRTNLHQRPLLDSKEDTHPLSSSAAEQTNVVEIIAETCEKQNIKDQDSDSNLDSPNPVPSANNSSNIEPSSLTFENPSPSDSSLKSKPEFPQIDILDLKELPTKSVSVEQFTSEEPVSATKNLQCLDVVEICNKNEEINFEKSSLNVEVSEAVVTTKGRPLKGILKRNPRGCRGPCNCLNCASFRLHANRAFEFSRNQMHDAEEIASDLMKELNMLRRMLEKAAFHENNHAVIQLSSVQVREACKKAQETERQAEARLNQLNYDLDVHCRMPGLLPPQVTFAERVQERALPSQSTIE